MISFFQSYGYVFEILVCIGLYTCTLQKKKLFLLRIAAWLLVSFAVMFIWNYCVPDSIILATLQFLLLYIVCALGIWFCFDIPLFLVLFCWTEAWATQRLANRVGETCREICILLSVEAFLADIIYVIVEIIVWVLAFFIFARKTNNFKHEPNKFSHSESRTIVLFFCVLTVAITLMNFFFESFGGETSIQRIVYSVSHVILCIVILYGQYELLRAVRLQGDKQFLEYALAQQKQQFEMSKKNIELINVKCHDLRKQIQALGNNVDSADIDRLSTAMHFYDSTIKTGNDGIDIVLAEKMAICEKEHIQIDCLIKAECLSFLSLSDVYAIFENAIANAIEALKHVQNTKKRVLMIRVRERMNVVSIHFENYYEDKLYFEDGLPLTTKNDNDWHGYGLKSIRMIAERYGGVLSIVAKDCVFSLNLLFPKINQ